MIASAKSSYDTQDAHFRQLAAYLVETDQLLAQYGPQAIGSPQADARSVPAAMDRIWREKAAASQDTAFTANSLAEQLYTAIDALSPANDAQRSLKARIVQAIDEIARVAAPDVCRCRQADPDAVLFDPDLLADGDLCQLRPVGRARRVVAVALLVFALSVSSALFLVADLSRPFAGLMQIPKEQLRHTLAPLPKS